jgi:hypothetical protein
MQNDESKPWDARLVDWMSRGSGEARAGVKHQWTPKQRVAYGAFWTIWISVSVATNGRHVQWWLFPVIITIAFASQVGIHLWQKRRR